MSNIDVRAPHVFALERNASLYDNERFRYSQSLYPVFPTRDKSKGLDADADRRHVVSLYHVHTKSVLLTWVDESLLKKLYPPLDHFWKLMSNLTAPLDLPLSKEQLDEINIYLSALTPEEILQWGLKYLPGLYQTTAFGLTGLVAIDMLSKITKSPPPLIFLDTLYHFPETYELVEEVKKRYGIPVHVYRPEKCNDTREFEEMYGQRLWETDEDTYDFVVKVEPARRAYENLGVKSVITGRRATQGADRATLQPLEIDSTGLLKLNPLYQWNFHLVEWYIKEQNVPRNKLLEQGYRSVGDWHSTAKVAEGQDERSGRWAGKEKTECGLHKDYFAMKAQAKTVAA